LMTCSTTLKGTTTAPSWSATIASPGRTFSTGAARERG
jgi:hypothetical protein